MSSMFSRFIFGFAAALVVMGCGATALVSTPIENIDTTPLKLSELTEAQKKSWGLLDMVSDTVPGMSVDKAYAEIIGNKKGQKVVVAILDTGIDLMHEDLANVIWTNKGEKPGNGKDDDGNGYIDDIHGYNFIGEAYNEQKEEARIVRLKIGDAAMQARARAKVESDYASALQNKQQLEQILQAVTISDQAVKKELGKDTYTKKEVAGIQPKDQAMQQYVGIVMQMYTLADSIPQVLEELQEELDHYSDQVNYHDNINFDGRKIVGDNPYDLNDRGYGNGDPKNLSDDEIHGTHVAGIVAAERNNGKGMNGVANNVAIMGVRILSNGDEYDKDVALGIRYAVDNGAKIINGSFGKSFSPNAQWVYDAIEYAAKKDVLFVHAAGNDGADLDDPNEPNFPNDQVNNGPEMTDNVITVGALDPKYGAEMLASYSNYGHINVDVFAPGTDIYSTIPNNRYKSISGTSMAAPGVTGIAALIRSQYPTLTAPEVKRILMNSGLMPRSKVVLGGNPANTSTFDKISTSGKMVNAYNALIMAEAVAKGHIKL